jgi:hypothetical protein
MGAFQGIFAGNENGFMLGRMVSSGPVPMKLLHGNGIGGGGGRGRLDEVLRGKAAIESEEPMGQLPYQAHYREAADPTVWLSGLGFSPYNALHDTSMPRTSEPTAAAIRPLL